MAAIRVVAGGVPQANRTAGEILPPGHLVLQFASYPAAGVRADLTRRGVHILAYVPSTGLLVSSESAWASTGLGLVQAGPIDGAAKLRGVYPGSNGPYLAIFHADIDPSRGRRLAEAAGLTALDQVYLLPGHLLVDGGWDGIRRLAQEDAVLRIIMPSRGILERRRLKACPGAISEAGLVADYALEGSQWAPVSGSVALNFVLDNSSTMMSANAAAAVVNRAFQEWAQYTNVTITQAGQPGEARSIDILFATGAHGDAYPFTSASTLGHTFYPPPANPEPLAGDIHFNDVENWDAPGGIDLFSVALHEAGHALGLAHSADPNSVMYAYYHEVSGLTADDIAAIQALYGKPGTAAGQPAPTPTPPASPSPPAPPTQPTQPGGNGGAGPSLAITSPAATIVSVYAPSLTVSGTASDSAGVSSVTWSTSTGGSGTATGTTNWSAVIALYIGNTTVTVRAYDNAGNSSWRSLTVVRVQ